MYLNEVKPKFKLSQGDLIQLGNGTLTLLNRDTEEFAKYGVNAAYKSSLLELVTAYNSVMYDELYEQRQMLATDQKNKIADELKTALRRVMLILESAYSTRNIMYISFRNTEISKMTDSDLLIKAKSSAQILTDSFSQIVEFGLTTAIIDELFTLAETLNENLTAQTTAVQNRDNATQFRVNIANNLYEKVSRIRSIGRKMWAELDEAKSNDYVIYDKSSTPNIPVIPDEEDSESSTQDDNG